MTEDTDYKDLLDSTVDEVRDRIDDLKNPDYGKLLDLEKQGKDRKTVKDYIEDKVGSDDSEEGVTDEPVSETESSSDTGVSGNDFTPRQALAGGLLAGLLIGIIAASVGMGFTNQAGGDAAEIRQDIEDLVTAGGFNGTVTVSEPEMDSGMYYFNINLTRQTVNGTQSSSQNVYVTTDGKLLFQEQRVLGQRVSPVPIQKRLAQLEQRGNATAP